MRLLLDEDTGARSLLEALRADGHDVECVVDVGALGTGSSDDDVFAHAVNDDRVLVTRNGSDFADIIEKARVSHPGALVIHYRADGSSLPVAVIVRAIATIGNTYATTKDLLLSVNHHVWR